MNKKDGWLMYSYIHLHQRNYRPNVMGLNNQMLNSIYNNISGTNGMEEFFKMDMNSIARQLNSDQIVKVLEQAVNIDVGSLNVNLEGLHSTSGNLTKSKAELDKLINSYQRIMENISGSDIQELSKSKYSSTPYGIGAKSIARVQETLRIIKTHTGDNSLGDRAIDKMIQEMQMSFGTIVKIVAEYGLNYVLAANMNEILKMMKKSSTSSVKVDVSSMKAQFQAPTHADLGDHITMTPRGDNVKMQWDFGNYKIVQGKGNPKAFDKKMSVGKMLSLVNDANFTYHFYNQVQWNMSRAQQMKDQLARNAIFAELVNNQHLSLMVYQNHIYSVGQMYDRYWKNSIVTVTPGENKKIGTRLNVEQGLQRSKKLKSKINSGWLKYAFSKGGM